VSKILHFERRPGDTEQHVLKYLWGRMPTVFSTGKLLNNPTNDGGGLMPTLR
jgi:hypothetical protein